MSDDKGSRRQDHRRRTSTIPSTRTTATWRELPPHRLSELQRFFQDYKVLENKAVDVDRIRGRAAAEQVIRDAVALYRDRIAPAATRPGSSLPN